MNWTCLRPFPWLDTRAQFVAQSPPSGTLLDLGSSDGETLGHIVELRPDLKLFAADKCGVPEKYPAPCEFRRADFEREALPWPDRSMDVITCMHLDFTFNFYDDPTHVRLVPIDALACEVRRAGLRVGATGTSRNWLFAAAHLAFAFLPPSRKKFTAHVHWLGWSAYLIADRPR
jgi:hypothetical protein